MSLGVQSYPELYTMLIGWNLYAQLWTLLSQTGLAFIPFMGIIIRNMTQPYESQETKDAATTSLRRMEIDLIATLLIIFLGVSPALTLSPSVLSYTPTCQTDHNATYHPGDTQTTWDTAFTIPSNTIRVPIWWYAVLSVSEGIASAANNMVSCTPNLRSMITQVNMTQVTDPALKQELQQFELDCYVPARTQYLKDNQANTSSLQTINQDRTQYGVDDTEWLGSHSFQDTYYQYQKASQPVVGFTYDPSQDINADANKTNPPAYGTPSCSQWWNDSEHGLKTRLATTMSNDFWTEFDNHFSDEKHKENVVKQLITQSNTGYDKANNTIGDYGYSHAVESIGAWVEQLNTYPKLYAAAQIAPIIQALLLLLAYTFLPFALVFSGYKPSTFVSGAIILFSLIFWSFIWHLVSYVDSTLMNALYSDSWFAKQTPSATLADMVIGILIIVAPLFWFSFMAAMGVTVSDLVSIGFTELSGIGNKAAAEGVKATKQAASSLINKNG